MNNELDINTVFRSFAASRKNDSILLLNKARQVVGSIFLNQLEDPYDIVIMLNDHFGEKYYLVYKKTFGIFFSYYQFS